jgi:hypothetical protein
MQSMNVIKATALQLRKSLLMSDALVRTGVRFVPIPVLNEEEYQEKIKEMNTKMDQLIELAEL